MYSKDDFLREIENVSLKYPKTAALFKAGDPRIFQFQESIATQLAMLSTQIEIAMQEPFLKSRDATVLADAALKGLLFSASPAKVEITIQNPTEYSLNLQSGRGILDSSGRYYSLDEPVSIPAKNKATGEYGTVSVVATQIQSERQTHTVIESYPFYAIEVEQPKDGSFICGLSVHLNGEALSASYKFNGFADKDNVFHIESDEFKRLLVRFGENGVIGIQPENGDVIEIEKQLCFGDIVPELDSQFSLQYLIAENEEQLILKMKALKASGAHPVNMATLRELVKYPSVYDKNAVFLGEFDMAVRRYFPHLYFLNVWNEQQEEQARGASIDNVNTLFFSFVLPENSTISQDAVKTRIREIILQADNSYKTKFVEPVLAKVGITVSGVISRTHDSSTVQKQIIELLLSKYGKGKIRTQKTYIKHRDVFELLTSHIQALQDSKSDLKVSVSNQREMLPETFKFVDENSINIQLTSEGYDVSMWGGTL